MVASSGSEDRGQELTSTVLDSFASHTGGTWATLAEHIATTLTRAGLAATPIGEDGLAPSGERFIRSAIRVAEWWKVASPHEHDEVWNCSETLAYALNSLIDAEPSAGSAEATRLAPAGAILIPAIRYGFTRPPSQVSDIAAHITRIAPVLDCATRAWVRREITAGLRLNGDTDNEHKVWDPALNACAEPGRKS